MTNLTSDEAAEWTRRCAKAREIARQAPCYHHGQALMDCYRFNLGPWNFTFTLSRFMTPPSWQGSVSLFKEISEERVTDVDGKYLFDAPNMAMVSVHSWDHEEYDIARDLLAEVFGPLIHDEHQRVVEMKGQMTLNWLTSEKEAGTLN